MGAFPEAIRSRKRCPGPFSCLRRTLWGSMAFFCRGGVSYSSARRTRKHVSTHPHPASQPASHTHIQPHSHPATYIARPHQQFYIRELSKYRGLLPVRRRAGVLADGGAETCVESVTCVAQITDRQRSHQPMGAARGTPQHHARVHASDAACNHLLPLHTRHPPIYTMRRTWKEIRRRQEIVPEGWQRAAAAVSLRFVACDGACATATVTAWAPVGTDKGSHSLVTHTYKTSRHPRQPLLPFMAIQKGHVPAVEFGTRTTIGITCGRYQVLSTCDIRAWVYLGERRLTFSRCNIQHSAQQKFHSE